MAKKPREANFELLRILSMWMVVILHTLSRADALVEIGMPLSPLRLVGNYMEALCIVAVNVYVLLSGYFLSGAPFRLKRLGRLLGQVFFYVWLIPVCMVLLGQSVQITDIWSIFHYLLPVSMEHYWFITAYVLLFAFLPVLNAGIAALEQKTYRKILWTALFFFCILKSICPVQLNTDRAGYDFGWFICLYLLAAYGRRYGFLSLLPAKIQGKIKRKIQHKEAAADGSGKRSENAGKRRAGLCLYLVSASLLWLLSCLLWIVHERCGALAYYAQVPFHYNALLTLTGALGIFTFFRYCTIREGWAARIIRKLSPYTLGVYLIHEHMDLRDRWFGLVEKLLGQVPENPLLFVIWVLAAAIVVYVVCTAIDWVRSKVFRLIGRCLPRASCGL